MHSDVLIGLNSFVYKYLDCINRFYTIVEVEDFSEVWKLKECLVNFDVVGTINEWSSVLNKDSKILNDVENDGYCSNLILLRDENF